jgi:hypothetical protein
MKYVQESLYEYDDTKFFMSLNEADEEISPADKEKMKTELERKGNAVVKKCQNNFKNFQKFAGKIWQEYRDFWTTQKDADESVQQKGMFYNMWKSDYIVGVVKEPNGNAKLKVFNTSSNDPDEYIVFETGNKDVVMNFKTFLKDTVEGTMKNIIDSQKQAMAAKKEADAKRQKEEAMTAKKAKLDAFLSESKEESRNKGVYIVVRQMSKDPKNNKYIAKYIPKYSKAAPGAIKYKSRDEAEKEAERLNKK